LAESDESKESETSDNSDNTTGINTNIKMSTVDRSPIVRAMQQRGMTESDLADAVNVDKSTISRILRTPKDTQGDPGGRNPSIGLAASIANVLKMDAESMFPDIFGVPDDGLSAKKTPSNKGSGMNNAASGSTRRSKGLQ
jgi:DNA-binding XRE family transcriptional regulator